MKNRSSLGGSPVKLVRESCNSILQAAAPQVHLVNWICWPTGRAARKIKKIMPEWWGYMYIVVRWSGEGGGCVLHNARQSNTNPHFAPDERNRNWNRTRGSESHFPFHFASFYLTNANAWLKITGVFQFKSFSTLGMFHLLKKKIHIFLRVEMLFPSVKYFS